MTDTLLGEIREQPGRWRALADDGGVVELGRRLGAAKPGLVRLAAHGTSDHAATYAVYALRLLCGWTAMRDSMSLSLYYGTPAAAPGDLAIGLSQSGATRDVVAWLQAARTAGADTLAVTNDPGSPLARSAGRILAVGAGEERSIAATKTYTCTLAALMLVGAHAAGRGAAMAGALRTAADHAEAALPALERAVEEVATKLSDTSRMYVVARGIEVATASEVALKLTEVAYVGAKALTATGMAHGPVAALDQSFPVWAIASDDATLPAVVEAVERARQAGAPVVVTGPAAGRMQDVTYSVPTPAADPLVAPLLSVLSGQLFARALALAKGIDPAKPRHLRKITAAA